LEDACLDSDALIEAYQAGISRFSGLHTTCISLYEFLRGLAYLKKDVGEYKTHLESHLNVLGLDNQGIVQASKIFGDLKRTGSLVQDPDLLIAGICLANSLPLVTGNAKHFERFGKYGLALRPLDEFMEAVGREEGGGRSSLSDSYKTHPGGRR
jgi:tRNA(fMet)-specific endonuclease VapC